MGMKLNNKVALVTASTRGIGLSIVKACAKEGARVYLAGRDLPRAQAIAEEQRKNGLDVHAVYLDASKVETFSAMVEQVARDAGRIDVLVNNFGTSNRSRDLDFRHTDAEIFLDTVNINLRSVYLASQAVLAHMPHGGSIINISSVGGIVPDVTQVAYGTSKAAINYLTKLIAVHEAKNGIRCNAILPGMTATDAVERNLPDAFRALFLKNIPLGRMTLPEEIASAAVYFASDDSASTTGQILTISGGFGLATPLYSALNDAR